MDMTLAIGIAGGVLAGVIAALTIIAPLTKTKVDDKVLDYALKVESVGVSTGVIKPLK